jgi:hypothetical protein
MTFDWAVLPKDIQGDRKDYRNEYVILHLFDKSGNHIGTRHWLGGTTNQVSDATLDAKLVSMVAELGDVQFGDIEVKLFQTEIDGKIFGLIPETEYGFIELQPHSTIAFSAPLT